MIGLKASKLPNNNGYIQGNKYSKNNSPYYVKYGPDKYHTESDYAIWKDDYGNWCLGPYSLLDSPNWTCSFYSPDSDICSAEWYVVVNGAWEEASNYGGVSIECDGGNIC